MEIMPKLLELGSSCTLPSFLKLQGIILLNNAC